MFGRKKNCFIVAEVSANHCQKLDYAVKAIHEAKKCGADAVKFQAYTPETLTIDVDNRHFRVNHPEWGGQTLFELYKKAYAPWHWFKKLKKVSDDIGIEFFSTAFDKSSVDMLEDVGVKFHKIASFELVDLGLIEYIAKTRKPLIISTGMADKNEIKEAIEAAVKGGARSVTLLKCVSSYPASAKNMNLRTIPHMQKTFGLPVGLSDHSMGIAVALTAVSLGAVMIEKHFTLSRKLNNPDSFFSLEPEELKELVDNVRIAEASLGKICYGGTKEEQKSRVFRRSLFAVEDIKKGEKLSEENIRSIRPGSGMKPKFLKSVLGRLAKTDIKKGTPIKKDLIS